MRIAILSTREVRGGAGRAARRLHNALAKSGVNVRMFVLEKEGTQRSWQPSAFRRRVAEFLNSKWESVQRRRFPNSFKKPWTSARWGSGAIAAAERWGADVLNIHWTGAGFVGIEELGRTTLPVIFTLHDMWTFTGGCHYSGSCERYRAACGQCPVLESAYDSDPSRRIHLRKQAAWASLKGGVISPSRWLAKCAKQSSLLGSWPVHVVPNTLDTGLFAPRSARDARAKLGLPQDRTLALFVDDRRPNPRKGFSHFAAAVKKVRQNPGNEKLEVLLLGPSNPPSDLAVPVRNVGRVHAENDLPDVYAACDFMVSAAVDENLPNTVLEAMSCGRACIALDAGGLPDLISHEKTGLLINPDKLEDLVDGIQKLAHDSAVREAFGESGRDSVMRTFTEEKVAAAHIKIVEAALSRR